MAVQVEPLTIGTNQVLGWQRDTNDPRAIAEAQQMHIELVNLSPAGGFFVAFQVAIYGGMVLASPFIFYFVVSFVFPALKMREQKYVYRAIVYRRRTVSDRRLVLLFRSDAGGAGGIADVFQLARLRRAAMARGGLHQLRLPIHAGHGAGL